MSQPSDHAQIFPTTRWTAIGRAGKPDADGRVALAELLERYLQPLRVHLIRQKHIAPDHADELLQAFVTEKVLARDLFGAAVQEKGRFRTFLLTALDRFVSNQLRNDRRRRARPTEGGNNGASILPESAQELTASEPCPGDAFDIAWARRVLATAAERMREACDRGSRADVWGIFEARVLGPTLTGAEPLDYGDLAQQYALAGVDAACNLLVTGKRMFARNLRAVVGEYMGEGGEVEQEIADLRAVLARART